MIDERKLIEEIQHECKQNAGELYEEDIIKIINKQPKVGEWIPCSERLPEEFGWYLTTCKEKQTVQMKFYDEMWASVTKVIAWMPLPEVYKGENNVD